MYFRYITWTIEWNSTGTGEGRNSISNAYLTVISCECKPMHSNCYQCGFLAVNPKKFYLKFLHCSTCAGVKLSRWTTEIRRYEILQRVCTKKWLFLKDVNCLNKFRAILQYFAKNCHLNFLNLLTCLYSI